MKKNYLTLVILSLSVIFFSGCAIKNNNNTQDLSGTVQSGNTVQSGEVVDVISIGWDTTKNSVDRDGSYKGTLPCADCEGIKTELTISDDNKYKIEQQYLGVIPFSGMTESENKFQSEGIFAWDASGSIITLDTADGIMQFFVWEWYVRYLDASGFIITGALEENYILRK